LRLAFAGADEDGEATGAFHMAKLPTTFEQALKSGYHVTKETTQESHGRRTGTLHLKDGSRPELVVTYEADRTGYRFGEPQPAN
jgi:hypothetical protein